MQDHMEVRPWRPHGTYVLYFARGTEHIEGRKSACALKLRSHTGHVSSFWTAGFHESNCPRAITFCVRGLASGRPR